MQPVQRKTTSQRSKGLLQFFEGPTKQPHNLQLGKKTRGKMFPLCRDGSRLGIFEKRGETGLIVTGNKEKTTPGGGGGKVDVLGGKEPSKRKKKCKLTEGFASSPKHPVNWLGGAIALQEGAMKKLRIGALKVTKTGRGERAREKVRGPKKVLVGSRNCP